MCIVCISHLYYVYIKCKLHVYYMYIMCIEKTYFLNKINHLVIVLEDTDFIITLIRATKVVHLAAVSVEDYSYIILKI